VIKYKTVTSSRLSVKTSCSGTVSSILFLSCASCICTFCISLSHTNTTIPLHHWLQFCAHLTSTHTQRDHISAAVQQWRARNQHIIEIWNHLHASHSTAYMHCNSETTLGKWTVYSLVPRSEFVKHLSCVWQTMFLYEWCRLWRVLFSFVPVITSRT